MYMPDAVMEKDALRQGDIIKNVHLLGALDLRYIHTISPPGPQTWLYNEKPIYGSAMVLSHSCEIDKENGVKLTSIILAPLRDFNAATPKEKKEELIASNIINDTSTASYLKYFYLPPHPQLEFSNGVVVDFSKCFSLKKHVYDLLLSNKIIQLDDESANNMAIKLAFYYYRLSAT